jgi:hypothetical protein
MTYLGIFRKIYETLTTSAQGNRHGVRSAGSHFDTTYCAYSQPHLPLPSSTLARTAVFDSRGMR